MILSSRLLLLFLLLFQLSLTDLFAEGCRPPLARQVVDQLIIGDIDHANEILALWQQQAPDDKLAHQFYRSMTLWTVAEISLDEQKEDAQEAALISLEKTLSSIEKNGAAVSDDIELRLLTGMTQAFAGRIYLERNHWFDAYKYGRAGRDTLRKLVQDHPDIEEAYLILGLYEYYAGSVSESLRWLTSLIDLDGDAALGLQYLERAAQYSTIAGPEAARMLLNGIKFIPVQGCGYLTLAASMRNYFITLPVLHWIPVFTRPETVSILLEPLKILSKDGLKVYAYVVLENHYHLVVQSNALDRDIARYKSYTAKKLIQYLSNNGARQILEQLAFYKKAHKNDRAYQFWQEGVHPELIQGDEMMKQKVDYIHHNPVKRES